MALSLVEKFKKWAFNLIALVSGVDVLRFSRRLIIFEITLSKVQIHTNTKKAI